MLQKILKYDMKAIFKYWWILAVTSLGLSVVGGLALNIIYSADRSDSPFLILFAMLLFMVAIFAISAFIIGSEIFVVVRYYRNFFTDEGYLTFTLPVSRTSLLNSKLISSVIANLSTGALAFIEFILLFCLSPIGKAIVDAFNKATQDPGTEVVVGGSEAAIAAGFLIMIFLVTVEIIIASIAGTLITFCCITFAAVVTKKHKILTAIGIYYAAGIVTSGISQIGSFFVTYSVSYYLAQQTAVMNTVAVLLILLIAVALTVAATVGLYTFNLHLLRKKLNLS